MYCTVSIWGCGFVGTAAYKAFSKNSSFIVKARDQKEEQSKLNLEVPNANFVSEPEALKSMLHLVCLPTPMKRKTGECDITIVETTVKKIANANIGKDIEIVIKSTVPVGTCEKLAKKYNVKILFNPEFLTEENAYEDFISLPYQIFGFTKEYNSTFTHLTALYSGSPEFKKIDNFIYLNSKEAELVKLLRNCYLATRLSFFNEMKQYSKFHNIENYDKITAIAGLDQRVGQHYNKIHDGTFGGHCLPKDLNNVIFEMLNTGNSECYPYLLKGAWDRNLKSNKVKDWEKMLGRAVIEEKE